MAETWFTVSGKVAIMKMQFSLRWTLFVLLLCGITTIFLTPFNLTRFQRSTGIPYALTDRNNVDYVFVAFDVKNKGFNDVWYLGDDKSSRRSKFQKAFNIEIPKVAFGVKDGDKDSKTKTSEWKLIKPGETVTVIGLFYKKDLGNRVRVGIQLKDHWGWRKNYFFKFRIDPKQVKALNERTKPGPMASELKSRASDKGFLSIKLPDYLELVDWTGRQIRGGKRGRISDKCKPILERLGLSRSVV